MLIDKGADYSIPSNEGFQPIFVAAQAGHIGIVKLFIDLGASVNATCGQGETLVFTAAESGNVGIVRLLATLNANMERCNDCGVSPLSIANQYGYNKTFLFLMNVGVDIRGCVDIEDSVHVLWSFLNKKQYGEEGVSSGDKESVCSILSLAKIMSSVIAESDEPTFALDTLAQGYSPSLWSIACCYVLFVVLLSCNSPEDRGWLFMVLCGPMTLLLAAYVTCDCEPPSITASGPIEGYQYVERITLNEVELHVCMAMWSHLSRDAIKCMQNSPYVLRKKLVRIAYRVYQSSLSSNDGSNLTEENKALRFTSLACFLLDPSMLHDVLSLRLTCKSNNERRRFPVYNGFELEANLVEEWLGCGSACSSRFVSTGDIFAVIAMHIKYSS